MSCRSMGGYAAGRDYGRTSKRRWAQIYDDGTRPLHSILLTPRVARAQGIGQATSTFLPVAKRDLFLF
jgi:hypothetical protein